MKKIIGIIAILLTAVTGYATIKSISVNTSLISQLKSIRMQAVMGREAMKSAAEKLSLSINNNADVIDSKDSTNISALITKIQQAENDLNNIVISIDKNFPEIQ